MAQVLIVDDDPVARLLLRHMLERLGHSVIEAEGARQALDLLRDEPPSVAMIICDFVMPERTGLDLLDDCADLGISPSPTPFVLLTGELRREDLDDDRVGNVTAYLTKPVSSGELERVVSTHLRGTMAEWEQPIPITNDLS